MINKSFVLALILMSNAIGISTAFAASLPPGKSIPRELIGKQPIAKIAVRPVFNANGTARVAWGWPFGPGDPLQYGDGYDPKYD